MQNKDLIFLLFIWQIGCREETKMKLEPTADGVVNTDLDGDGYSDEEDCDDGNAMVHFGMLESCDGIDNNCDGNIDEGVGTIFYLDIDGDGFGHSDFTEEFCEPSDGYVPNGGDCDDQNSDIYPGATEICDGKDNNCDGSTDEGQGVFYYADVDGDGFGNDNELVESCILSDGLSAIGGDCDDSNSAINPVASEYCDGLDNDCDGEIDEQVGMDFFRDADEDGFGDPDDAIFDCFPPEGYILDETDCNDLDTQINPLADELCDGVDNNCDGVIDEDDALDALLWYQDTDADQYGDAANPTSSCNQPVNYVADASDCNDNNENIYPSASEYCNGLDDNCDGAVDEMGASGGSTYYEDQDQDGFGDPSLSISACSQPIGYVLQNTDCDDNNNTLYPGATEYCNGLDDNCDGTTDEQSSVDAQSWYFDGDGDGFGDSSSVQPGCSAPINHVAEAGDCNDSEAAINPQTQEICDGVDNDCDGFVDDSDPDVIGQSTYYLDHDVDGYGDSSFSIDACSAPTSYVLDGTDCDDLHNEAYPGAIEICDGLDNDCDGVVDTADPDLVDASTWYFDGDGDGYGASAIMLQACSQPTSHSAIAGDCDDGDNDIHPNAEEYCNSEDDNCDGNIDEEPTVDGGRWYFDGDGDGYGDDSQFIDSCLAAVDHIESGGDCDDGDDTINPGVTEIYYDGIDQDCSGGNDNDQDGDGLDSAIFANGVDCNDQDSNLFLCGDQQVTAVINCKDLLEIRPGLADGVYWLDPDGDGDYSDAWQGYCDMTRDAGGWTLVVQNNQSISHGASLSYAEATQDIRVRGGLLGSNLDSFDMWVGLDEWDELGTESRVEVGNAAGVSLYQGFYSLTIDPNDGYRLDMSGGSLVGTLAPPGIVSYHSGRQFTASDVDQDSYLANCAHNYNSPWWYGACWSGSLWGHHETDGAYWTGSNTSYPWGAIWLR